MDLEAMSIIRWHVGKPARMLLLLLVVLINDE